LGRVEVVGEVTSNQILRHFLSPEMVFRQASCPAFTT